jgi:hypothetical protein
LHQPTFKFNTRSASVTYRRIGNIIFPISFFFSFAYVNHFSIDQKEPFDGKTDALCYYTNNAAAIRIFFLNWGASIHQERRKTPCWLTTTPLQISKSNTEMWNEKKRPRDIDRPYDGRHEITIFNLFESLAIISCGKSRIPVWWS